MRFAFLTAVAFVVSISAVGRISRGDDGEDEWARLDGTWEVVDENVDGQSRNRAGLRNAAKVMIFGRSMILLNKLDSLNYEAKLRDLNPSASPAAVDLMVEEDGKKVRKFPAVYKLDGDGLQICWWFKDETKPRPNRIEKGEGLRLLVLRRVKEAEQG
ncbi:MAG TPA: TIGR03067 domain-containing protein [Tepidisphaeraceae bacterium]|nr:TIGR03067 domain-containing protein [Tepidisphaeraceae bacterium]